MGMHVAEQYEVEYWEAWHVMLPCHARRNHLTSNRACERPTMPATCVNRGSKATYILSVCIQLNKA